MSAQARQAYLEHCSSWGGFDSAEDAAAWASRSESFSAQVDAHVGLLDSFAARAVRRQRPLHLGLHALGAVLMFASIVGAYFAGLAQRLDELDGPIHRCPGCPLEHVQDEGIDLERCRVLEPGRITPADAGDGVR